MGNRRSFGSRGLGISRCTGLWGFGLAKAGIDGSLEVGIIDIISLG
jgi:hypothetical protein